ncbi:hypothetical protein LLUC7005_13150 (plasmid) [Lactococcus lactis subsp. lactis]
MEALASKVSSYLSEMAKKQADDYILSVSNQVNANLNEKNHDIYELGVAIRSSKDEMNNLRSLIGTYDSEQKNKKKKDFVQELMFVLGAFLALMGVALMVYAFSSALYEAGISHIWTWDIIALKYTTPTWQKGLFIIIKVILSLTLFMIGVFFMFLPLMAFKMFLVRLDYKYKGFGAKLNKFFNIRRY